MTQRQSPHRLQPMSVATKEQVESTLHGMIVDLMGVHSQIRFAYGASMGARVQREIWRLQNLLNDVEKREPDTSQREHPP